MNSIEFKIRIVLLLSCRNIVFNYLQLSYNNNYLIVYRITLFIFLLI